MKILSLFSFTAGLKYQALRRFSFSLLVPAFAVAAAGNANAATSTWTGNSSADWITAGNWGGTAPASGATLAFGVAGSSGVTLTNTLTSSAFNVAGITFSSSAPAYTMNGNTFNLTSGITNSSSALQTFSNTGGLSASASMTFTLGGGITLTNGLTGTFGAANDTITVTGAGQSLTLGSFNIDTSTTRQTTSFNGTGNVNITGNITAGDSVDSLTYSGSGTLTIAGGLSVNGNGSSLNVSSGTIYLTSASQGAPVNVTGSGSFSETSAGSLLNVGGSTAFTQSSTGTTTLAGANTYSGATTVSNGTFNLSGAGTLSGGTAIAVSGGAFNESGGAVISAGSTFTTTGGTTTLSGINTYTGATSVNGGTLTLDFSAATAPTTAINIIKSTDTINLGGGALVIKGGGSGATNTQTFATTALTTLTSSTITVNSNGGTSTNLALGAITRNAQSTFDITLPAAGSVTTTLAQVPSNGILVYTTTGVAFGTANGGATWLAKATGTSPFALTAYTGYATGNSNYTSTNNVDVTNGDSVSGVTVNTLRFNSATDGLTLAGTNTVTTGGILVTPTATAASITGGTLEAGAGGKELVIIDDGALNVNSVIADNTSASLLTISGTGTTTLSAANTFSGTTAIIGTGNLQLGNANALQNSTLAFGSNSATANLTFSSGIGTFTVAGLAGSSNGANILTLTDTAGAGVNLQVGNNNTSSSFNSAINGAAGATVTKIGTGTWTLPTQVSGGNITVPVVVNNGTVYISGLTGLEIVPSLTINNNAVVYYARGSLFIASGTGDTVTINSGGLLSSDYVSTTGSADTAIGAITLNGGTIATRNQPTSGTPLIYDRGTFGFGGSGITAGTAAVTAGGGTNPTSTISAVNARLSETGGTIFNVMAGSGTGGSASAGGGVDLLFSGTILSRGNNANTTLIKQGNGVMELTGANSFITGVQINGGILQINSIANGGVTTTTGTATSSGSTAVTVTSATGIAAGQAVGFGINSGINAGTTVGSTYTTGTTVSLAIPTNSTDTGTTGAVAAGTALTFGTANPLGISTNAASNLILDGGTLQYVGGTGSTDRLFTIGSTVAGGTGTIDASGTGGLTFSNTGTIAYGTVNQTRTLILTGTSTASNTLDATLANNGTGSVSLTKSGVGTWVINGTNTYTGGTTISGGTLQMSGAGTLGATTSPLNVAGGSLDLNGTSQTVGATTLGGNSSILSSTGTGTLTASTVTVNSTGNTIGSAATVSGNVNFGSGAALADNGAVTGNVTVGTGTLTGSGSVSGTTSVTGGTVNGSGLTWTGLATFNSTGNILGGTVTANGGVTVASGAGLTQTGTLTLKGTLANNGTSTFSGVIADGSSAGSFTSTGTATLNGANTYTGATSVNAGTVNINTVGGASVAQSLGEGTVVNLGVAGTSSGLLNYTGGNGTLTGRTINALGNGNDTVQNSGGGTLTLSGGSIVKNGTTFTVKGAVNIAETVSGTAANSDIDYNNATSTVSVAGTYNGPTRIFNNSTVTNGVNDALPDTNGGASANTVVTLGDTSETANDTNTYSLGGYTQTLGGLLSANGSGHTDTNAVTGGSATLSTLTVNVAAGSDTYSGYLGSGTAGTSNANNLALVKSGTATMILTAANTYTGGTVVNGGTLYVNGGSLGGGTSGAGAGTVTVNSGGTLAGGGVIKSSAGGVTVQTGGTLSSGAAQVSDATHDLVNGTGTGGGLTLAGSSPGLLTVSSGSTLSFSLGAGGSTGTTFMSPNMNSTYLTLSNSGLTDLIFNTTTTADTIRLTDLTAFQPHGGDTLQLRYQSPYLLIASGLGNNNDFSTLVTSGGTGANGFVLGVSNGTGGYTAFNIKMYDINGTDITTSANYGSLQLYLYNGNLEVVPEPGTWVMMLGGLVLLVVIQRRRNKQC